MTDDLLNDDEPVHTWFELTYSNYAVLHRTLLQSMPAEWQRQFVACMEELDEAFAHIERAPGYEVKPCRWQAPNETDDATLTRLGFTVEDDGDVAPTYYDQNGTEHAGWETCVPVPVAEPVPHYDRGRSRIEPRMREEMQG